MQWASVCAFINEVNHNPKRQPQWPSDAVKLIQDLDRMLAEVFRAAPNLKVQSRAVYDNTRKNYERVQRGECWVCGDLNHHARAWPKAFINRRLISDKS
jgi:hypothetical protein